PLAAAAMARLGRLSYPRIFTTFQGVGTSRAGPSGRADAGGSSLTLDSIATPLGDHAGPDPGRAGDGLVCHRGTPQHPGDDLPAVPDGDGGQGNLACARLRPADDALD